MVSASAHSRSQIKTQTQTQAEKNTNIKFLISYKDTKNWPVGSVDKQIATDAGGLGFDSWADQIGHNVTAATFLRSCVAQTLSHGD